MSSEIPTVWSVADERVDSEPVSDLLFVLSSSTLFLELENRLVA